jgi:predicted transcriptional regulator of viral defense system
MRGSELVEAFEEKGLHVLTINDIVRMTGGSRAYAWTVAERLIKRNILSRAARGVYYTGKATLLEVASNIVSPSYVSLSSAFSYYGFLQQALAAADVITPKRHSDAAFGEARIHFITLKKERVFGFRRDNANIVVAEPEKAFVDALFLRTPQYGYVDAAFARAVQSGRIDGKRFLEYAGRMGVKALAGKAKAMIEENGMGAILDRTEKRGKE